ncbi:MAG TPA: outer membrane protein [Xanthobacteraceae bacterium]|nr:outer membrane protein [Xanthobacteraceae bacterium]
MSRVFFSMTAILAFAMAAQAANAADLPRRPPPEYPVKAPPLRVFDWTGFYAGINAGYGWGSSRFDFGAAGANHIDTSGGLVGGTLGYNYQIGQTVLGLEGDFDWQDVKSNGVCVAGVCQTKSNWLSTVRGRLGYAFDRFMPYVTGGAAFSEVKANIPGVGSASDTRTGWTVGGGAEYAFAPNWTVKAEYLYVDLGTLNCPACGANVKVKENVVRAGLNYKF